MIPIGYMAKASCVVPEGLDIPHLVDVFSVSDCVNTNFYEKELPGEMNGYGLYDSPEIVRAVASSHSVDLTSAVLFCYEADELEYDDGSWSPYKPFALSLRMSWPLGRSTWRALMWSALKTDGLQLILLSRAPVMRKGASRTSIA
jgi:hypothetical protein